MVAMTLLFEGNSAQDIGRQQQALFAVCKHHGGVVGDSASGARGYNLTHMIAYLRDFGVGYNFLSESFETSVPWDKVLTVYDAVLKRVVHEITHTLGVKTPPLVGGRVTQTYDTCAVLYVYFGFIVKGLKDPTEAFHHVETTARQTILECGGSLSHHHGVGKLRKSFVNQVMCPDEVRMLRGVKEQLDPENIFGAGNLCWDPNM
jgi:alkyldihydroxyacetonephosphate synthase